VLSFEGDEPGPLDGLSANTIESLITRAQGVFLTATLLSNEAALTAWHRLPEPTQHAESELRSAAAAQLDHTAALLMDGNPSEPGDLETKLANWMAVTSAAPSELSRDGRAALVQRLAAQARQFGQPPTLG
jgi:hypothetical protein